MANFYYLHNPIRMLDHMDIFSYDNIRFKKRTLRRRRGVLSYINGCPNGGALPEDPGDSCDVDLGDVNGDGTLNVLDVVLVVQFVLGSGTVEFECAADFNGDLVVNVLDIVSLVNEILS